MKDKQVFMEEFNNKLHRLGKITLGLSIVFLVSIPFVVGAAFGVAPDLKAFVSGFIKVGVIYIPVAIVEFLVYTPMLGVGGSYLSFITGNVTNMKIPCVMNAKEIAGSQDGTPEHEIISTLSVATSAMVTTVVIALGVVLMVPLQPVLQNPVLLPAFNNVVPALFGALGLKYFMKSTQIAVLPLALMTSLYILVPALISQTSLMLLPSGALALGIGFFLFKQGKLK